MKECPTTLKDRSIVDGAREIYRDPMPQRWPDIQRVVSFLASIDILLSFKNIKTIINCNSVGIFLTLLTYTSRVAEV